MEWTPLTDLIHTTGVRIATLVLADPTQGVAIRFADHHPADALPSRSTLTFTARDVGRSVVVVCEDDDAARPIIIGVLQDRPAQPSRDVSVNGQRVCVEADAELVLKSGKASITLEGDGRIVIKGMEIVSRARGTHKVKGATVMIN
jgi:uncharacterized protein DUF6484